MGQLRFASLVCGLILLASTAQAVDIVWDGGDGDWNDLQGKWNGGQISLDVFGRSDGLVVGSGEIGTDVFINDGHVTYEPSIFGDFRFLQGAAGNGGTLNISGGASLSMDTNFGDIDGQWTQFNADTMNLDNGTFRRTFSAPAAAGGVFSFGGIRSHADMDIKINLTNGGRIENSGPMTFGWYLSDELNRKVTMTINDGHLDLTGGNNWDYLGGAVGGAGNGDLQFHKTWNVASNQPNLDEYAINFTGPGSITVDNGGILVVVQTGPGGTDFDFSSILTPRSYQELWDLGILRANGLSGLDGASFASYFSVTGSPGADDYMLTSLVGTAPNGDFNGDGNWNCSDIDALVAEVVAGTNGSGFDLTGDGLVNGDDVQEWLAVGGANNPAATGGNPFLPGDANLSGAVDVSDFNIWNGNKFTNTAAWCSGDFTADGVVDVSDFNIWNGSKFTSSAGGVSAVPEPASALMGLLSGIAIWCAGRRRA